MGKDASHANKPGKKTDPYAYCRNIKCDLRGKNQAEDNEVAPEDIPRGKPKAKSKAKQKQAEKGKLPRPKRMTPEEHLAQAKANSAAIRGTQKQLCEACGRLECVCKLAEPEAVTKARARIKKALTGGGKYDQNVIGLALTILAQEMGNKDIADQLIDEYKLTERFGIQKFN